MPSTDEPKNVFEEYILKEMDLSPLNFTEEEQRQMIEIDIDLSIVREIPVDVLVENLTTPELWLMNQLNEIEDIHTRLLLAFAVLKLFFGKGDEDALV